MPNGMRRKIKVLVIGSGPITIGQAAEFDYAGVQACRQLKKEGIQIVLINSNPATIMTDTDIADKVYIEPIQLEFIEKIIQKERPDALFATFGGQTSLNIACELEENGILDKYGVQLLGTGIDSIKQSENRALFKQLMQSIGEPVPMSYIISNENEFTTDKIGYPVVIRPAYTLGGRGGTFVSNSEEFKNAISKGLEISPIGQVLVEKSLYGYKEIEFEVIRDNANNCLLVCSMENVDSMGIHTGDSIVVAPAQTLSDDLFNKLKKSAFNIISALDIVGGCNIQYAVNPENENEYYVIEVNPRVSRSSALASKATGFPIAKVTVKLALGYKLTDFSKDISKLEPKPDYFVVKMPKFSFDKFKKIDRTLTTSMKSTGEIMAIGKTLEEAFYKGLMSLETKFPVTDSDYSIIDDCRVYRIINALKNGVSIQKIATETKINQYFIEKLKSVALMNQKQSSDTFYAVRPYCEDNTKKSYLYSSCIDSENKITYKSKNRKVLIIGSGPIRIGQGIEFDYCCVHAAFALKELGYEAILINSNPETLSTDYDISSRLYFEPLTPDYIKNVIEFEKPSGIITQFGGQTAVNVVNSIKDYNILGTGYEAINITENRIAFNKFLKTLNIPQPKSFNGIEPIFPVTLRPSYTIGGFGVQIARNESQLNDIMKRASLISSDVIIDEFIDGLELEADVLCDGRNILVLGFIEHIEKTGIHSGDSIAVYPTRHITKEQKSVMTEYAKIISEELNIVGLMNIQFVIKENNIFVIEVNPRASRTIPILSKMTGFPICKKAVKLMTGGKLNTTRILPEPDVFAVKMPVYSFAQLGLQQELLTTEMKSTGEVLGIDSNYNSALLKAYIMNNVDFNQSPYFSCKETENMYKIAREHLKNINNIKNLNVNTIDNYIKKEACV